MYTTPVAIPSASVQITYDDAILTLGSCFSEHIGTRLAQSLFRTDVNPFGVLYNPLSVLHSLQTLLSDRTYTEADLFSHQSLWHSFDHSSAFSATTAAQCLERINTRLHASRLMWRDTRFILITWGTARVYTHTASDREVSNCHKLPAADFTRHCLRVDDIVAAYRPLLAALTDRHIIFTVSPIRHWKDGAHANNLSKATLLLAIDELQREFSHAHYFPAYELLLDELRDYRYYAADMLHPSPVAVDYIWQRFGECYFSPDTQAIRRELEQLTADLAHRPLHPDSDAYRTFAAATAAKRQRLEEKYPFLRERLSAR